MTPTDLNITHEQTSQATRSRINAIDLLQRMICELFAGAIYTSSEQSTSWPGGLFDPEVTIPITSTSADASTNHSRDLRPRRHYYRFFDAARRSRCCCAADVLGPKRGAGFGYSALWGLTESIHRRREDKVRYVAEEAVVLR